MFSCSSVSIARFAFQACSFNHSDISPFKWNQQFTGGRGPAQQIDRFEPNQLGVDYNAHMLESILKYVAPELGWR